MSESAIRVPKPGEVLAGKYRLTRLLGEGGMGVVLSAEHLRLRQSIAIKFLNPEMLGVDEIVQRFEREARAAATLKSRHVVRVTDVEVTPEGVPYMVMELLVGADLESERERRGKMPFAEVVDYVLQACSALAEAHDAGIVHRDLKPGNLFLAKEDGDRAVVKVLDFGISKFLKGEDAKLTSAGAIMGTALYMSPEQIRGDMSVDARSDIWSLGVILYELIAGDAPWNGAATRVAAAIVSEEAPDIQGRCPIPEGLARAVHSMLEKNASRRPQTIADVVTALAPYAAPGTIGAEIAEQLARRSQRNLSAVTDRSSQPSFSEIAPFAPAQTVRGAPERSTMAATTTNANMLARPRTLISAFIAFGVLAMAGIALIVFVRRSKSVETSTAAPQPTVAVTAEPSATGVAKPDLPAAPSAVPTPTSIPVASTTPTETVAPDAGRPAVATVKRPATTATAAPSPTTPAAPHPQPKTTETAPAANPLFLK